MTRDPGTITALLAQWSAGDERALPDLIELAYDDLRGIAHRRLRAVAGDGLDTTALVHEAFLKLVGYQGGAWDGRAQFFAFASRAMRHILVDHARREHALRRGGDAVRVTLAEDMIAPDDGSVDVLGVDEALERLTALDPRLAKVVELRFFGGLSVPEVATILELSPRTVERDWSRARAYLLEFLPERGAE
jgi:RNA polymerase sigma-70 factor, ECF subfamily